MFDCPKSILWRISLEVMSMFRALGLMKNTGRDVCNFLSYTDNVGELVSYIHCLFFHQVSEDVEATPTSKAFFLAA